MKTDEATYLTLAQSPQFKGQKIKHERGMIEVMRVTPDGTHAVVKQDGSRMKKPDGTRAHAASIWFAVSLEMGTHPETGKPVKNWKIVGTCEGRSTVEKMEKFYAGS